MLGASQGAASRAEEGGQRPKDGSSPGAVPQEQRDEDPAPEQRAELLERGRRGRGQRGILTLLPLGPGAPLGPWGPEGPRAPGKPGAPAMPGAP